MIEQTKQRSALAALNAILVLGRQMARQGQSADLVEILDVAEYLPMLMLDSKDCTAEFRQNLVDLARKRPAFEMALQRFDATDWPP
jgi:hypothetical protein